MDQTIGEIRMFAGGFAPQGWALCEGQILAVGQYPDLYHVIGNTYGGTAGQSFCLPDLRARTPIGAGPNPRSIPRPLGTSGGSSAVALTKAQLPVHRHALNATVANATSATVSAGAAIAQAVGGARPFNDVRVATGVVSAFSARAIGPNSTDGQPHENMMPSLAINFIIAVAGIMPQNV